MCQCQNYWRVRKSRLLVEINSKKILDSGRHTSAVYTAPSFDWKLPVAAACLFVGLRSALVVQMWNVYSVFNVSFSRSLFMAFAVGSSCPRLHCTLSKKKHVTVLKLRQIAIDFQTFPHSLRDFSAEHATIFLPPRCDAVKK